MVGCFIQKRIVGPEFSKFLKALPKPSFNPRNLTWSITTYLLLLKMQSFSIPSSAPKSSFSKMESKHLQKRSSPQAIILVFSPYYYISVVVMGCWDLGTQNTCLGLWKWLVASNLNLWHMFFWRWKFIKAKWSLLYCILNWLVVGVCRYWHSIHEKDAEIKTILIF